ncbi:MAG: cation transporter [Nitrospinota bacterium]
MKEELLKVDGMTCGHCVEVVTNSLKTISGLSSVEVNLDKKEVGVSYNEAETNIKEISDKIVEAGFEVMDS